MPLGVWEHEQHIDHCENWLHVWYIGDNRVSVMYRDEEFDNGSGMGLGVRMYLGPRQGNSSTPPAIPGTIPGPPIIEEPIPDTPPEEPDDVGCSNVMQETCPGNGAWSYNLWNFNDGKSVWTAHMKERFKAGAWVAGKLVNAGWFEDCLNNYSADDLTGSYGSTIHTSPPSGQEIFDNLYNGKEPSWHSTSGGVDRQADVLNVYFDGTKSCSVLASAGVPGSSISFSKCYYESSVRSPSTTASNMMHEWSHNMGYGHPSAVSNSYPYRVGGCISNNTSYNAEARTTFPGGNW